MSTLAVATIIGPPLGASPGWADPAPIPPRTAVTFDTVLPGVHIGTANEHEPRTGLSIVKLYLADYALRHGNGSGNDRALAERMIRYSDDGAADRISSEYPQAIDATAAEYHLTDTRAGTSWGSSYTSTADVATFLTAKQTRDPASPILGWMATAGRVSADGTQQNWGTARLPGVMGTKWGWSDFGLPDVASTSFGPGFSVATHTHGTPAEQDADVLDSLPRLLLGVIARR